MAIHRQSLGTITKFASGKNFTLAEFTQRNGHLAAKFALQAIARQLTPDERVKICYRHRLPDTPHLQLVHIPDPNPAKEGRGHVRGLMHCCSVWVCAVCSGRISLQRKAELLNAVDSHRHDLIPLHVTYTARHTKADRLADQLAALTDAYRRMRSGRWWQGFKQVYEVQASVRATEITYGENGWHGHFHELLFVKVGPGFKSHEQLRLFADGIEAQLSDRWLEVLAKVQLSAERQYALTVSTDGRDIGAYLAKYGHLPQNDQGSWTVAHEVTLQQSKRAGGLQGMTPWQLLWSAQTNERHAQLWREYVAATKGRSQLHWSRGAKALLGLDDLSDDDILQADETAEAELLALITPDQWQVFDRAGVVPQLLQAAADRNLARIERMLATADTQLTMQAARMVCLPCSADVSERVYFVEKGDQLICPSCGRVSSASKAKGEDE